MTLMDACREVMDDSELRAKYPKGLNSADILNEIRAKHGDNAFPLCSILDVHDEMEKLYGKGRRP